LLTFKALKDPLTAWVLKELSANGVNYRKQISPSPDKLLPEEHFRLLAARMRFPRQLASRIALQPQGPGTYDVQWGRGHDSHPRAPRDAGSGAEYRLKPVQRRPGAHRRGAGAPETATCFVEQSAESLVGLLRLGGHGHAIHDGTVRTRGRRGTLA
jgi:hypothetical protein